MQKLKDVIIAIYKELKYFANFDSAGISLVVYMKNRPIDVMNAYLKIVPYWVMKKPSEPSLITSAISYIFLGPLSFLRISHSILSEINKNTIENIHAVNDTIADVDDDINM